jgi:hypothetical protein
MFVLKNAESQDDTVKSLRIYCTVGSYLAGDVGALLCWDLARHVLALLAGHLARHLAALLALHLAGHVVALLPLHLVADLLRYLARHLARDILAHLPGYLHTLLHILWLFIYWTIFNPLFFKSFFLFFID